MHLNLKDKKVLVVGFGRSGVEAAKLLLSRGAIVSVADMQTAENLHDNIQEVGVERFCKLSLGGFDQALFCNSELIILSPGVPSYLPAIKAAGEKGVRIIGEAGLALSFITSLVVGITGTNGKSTTTALVGHIIGKCNKTVFVGGNIGVPLCAYVNSGMKEEIVVAELSSFQLEEMNGYSPGISVLLNISPDHLDRYDSFESYIDAKMNIFKNQNEENFAVINGGDKKTLEVADKYQFPSRLHYFNTIEGMLTIINGTIYYGEEIEVCRKDQLAVVGDHNLENVMAAVMVSLFVGLDIMQIKETLASFQGLPHRIEFVRESAGVKYYNDSKGTNVDSVMVAVSSFDSPVILLLGGRSKGGDFARISKENGNIKDIITFGESSGDISDQLDGNCHQVDTLKNSLELAVGLAKAGDVVLLSPGCTSFDRFANYIDRGNRFKQLVLGLK